jgi:hypothetical protein
MFKGTRSVFEMIAGDSSLIAIGNNRNVIGVTRRVRELNLISEMDQSDDEGEGDAVKNSRRDSNPVMFSDSEDDGDQKGIRGGSGGSNEGSSSVNKSQLTTSRLHDDDDEDNDDKAGAGSIDPSRMSDDPSDLDGKKRGVSDSHIDEKKRFLKNKMQRKNDDSDEELFSESPIKINAVSGVTRGRSVLNDSDED